LSAKCFIIFFIYREVRVMAFKFCPKCGACFESRELEGLQRLVCSGCGFIFYQNPKPTASAVVTDKDKILLVKRAIQPQKDCWDFPGGFLEEGEHPEQALRREMKEELGISIEITDFLGIYMDKYGYGKEGGHTLNIYYLAHITGGEPKPASDIDGWGWFEAQDIPSNMAFANNILALEAWAEKLQEIRKDAVNDGN
jgi:ADP-ribose pyrophosphatase YjhB (NUDIX family)